MAISQVSHLSISQPQAGHFNSSLLPSLHPKTGKMVFSLFINYADSFCKKMDDTKECEEFSTGSKCDTSAEIAKVIIILGYATNRSKEETGKNN